MKKLNLIFIALLLSLTFSCDDDSEGGTSFTTTLPTGSDLISEVTTGSKLTLSADGNYKLKQGLRVRDGGTLVIEEGVTITATGTQTNNLFIVVEQGGRIDAQGTATKPIVMTAETKSPGSWGGLIIAGKAPINKAEIATTEIGDAKYGGTDASDNSGVIKYLVTEYTGSQINSDKQQNGITFYGVGNGTIVEYIQAFKGRDDGIEMFGGTVNLKYVVCSGNQDDQFDFAEGYVGTVDYLYIEQVEDENYQQDRGIEGDNLGDDNDAIPFSNPTIKNFTLKGYDKSKNADGDKTDGMRIREGAKGEFTNFVITGFSDDGVDVRNVQTFKNYENNSLSFTNYSISGTGEGTAFDAGFDVGETDSDGTKAKIEALSATNGKATGADADANTTKFYLQDWVSKLK